jgi:hypothetical protein
LLGEVDEQKNVSAQRRPNSKSKETQQPPPEEERNKSKKDLQGAGNSDSNENCTVIDIQYAKALLEFQSIE